MLEKPAKGPRRLASLTGRSACETNTAVNRRQLLAAVTTAAAATTCAAVRPLFGQSAPATRPAELPADLAWHDLREWGVEGRGFADVERYFDRLPARAKGVVRAAVWGLSHDSAGMVAHFEADTPALYVRYTLSKASLAMPHMPATGVSGVDLYAKVDPRWQWLGVTKPAAQKVQAAIASGVTPGRRAYRLELPLYNGVDSLEVGVPKGAAFAPVPPRREKPVLFYGTSITQGGVASRPGMGFVNLLGRRLDRPMLNFGFSGNGKMELEVGRFLAELDAAVFVIDCVANMNAEMITERTGPLVKLLREARKDAAILLLEQRRPANAPLVRSADADNTAKAKALRGAFDRLVAEGVANLHYREGRDLIAEDGEGTTDGSHPNDLGMMRYADALEPTLRKLLGA